MPKGALLRLGLFQMGAGTVSVLLLGVLNRVLRVEMGADLLLVGVVLGGGHYLGAVSAIPFGYLSDRHPIAGLHRVPYIFGGVTVAGLALAFSPWVVRQLAEGGGPLWATLGLLFFLLEGVATYVAGTAYLSLITDRTSEAERGRATAFVWTFLMVGILVGVALSAAALGVYSFERLSRLFAASAVGVFVLAAVALWRQEPRRGTHLSPAESVSFGESLRRLIRSRQTRLFFAFLVVGLFSTFMQDVLLEPFGGEVLGLSIRATSMFNAYLMVGTIAAMWWGGVWLIPRRGKAEATALGAWIQVAAFGLLAACAALNLVWLSFAAVSVLGFGMGLFTVGGVALMMDMTQAGQAGLFVGSWTLAQALARGPAAIAGGGLHDLAVALGAAPGGAYAAVFVAEAMGLALAVYLLSQVGVPRFRQEVAGLGAAMAQAMDG